ncbi:MAG: MFS transporter, partial [Desulfobacterales bacterium]|nr:MFS transporter [Desulfobacterales bacterium]
MTITQSVSQLIRESRAIFYGWIVVACVCVILFIAFGSVYSFTTFFKSLQVEFQTTRSSTSLIFAIAGFIYFCLGAVSGQIADRIGSKWVITFGVLVIGTALLVASRAATVQQIYAIYGLGIGIGVGFVYVPAVGVVQRWFVQKRGLATGIAVTGIGLGTLCM